MIPKGGTCRPALRKYPPLEDLNFDQISLDNYLDKVGCKASYHRTNKSLESCGLKNAVKMATFDPLESEKTKKACTSISSLTFTYDENDNAHKDTFVIYIAYPSHYKEVVMVQAVDLQTAIGAAGGYIGLFLGNIV